MFCFQIYIFIVITVKNCKNVVTKAKKWKINKKKDEQKESVLKYSQLFAVNAGADIFSSGEDELATITVLFL